MSGDQRRHTTPLDDAAIAFSLLTVVPLPARWPDEGERTQAAAWFPVVGVFLGILLGALTYSMRSLGLAVGAVLVLVAYQLACGFLHFDGLADVADAWSVSEERRHDVLKDSRVGTFGVIAVVLVVALQVLSLTTAIRTAGLLGILVVTVPVFGRLAATFACWFGKPARRYGLGAAVIGRPRVYGAVLVALVLLVLVAALANGPDPLILGTGWFIGGIVVALVVPHLISMRFGGVTGDVLGASILVVETIMLVAIDIIGSGIR